MNFIYNYKHVKVILRNKPTTVEFTILETSEPLNLNDLEMILHDTLHCIFNEGAVKCESCIVPHIDLPKGIKRAAAIRVAGYVTDGDISYFEVVEIKKQYVKDIKRVDYILDKTTGSIKQV